MICLIFLWITLSYSLLSNYLILCHNICYFFVIETLGIVTDGKIRIRIADQDYECSEGEYFFVLPDVKHSIETVTDYYSMITTCIPRDDDVSRDLDIIKKEIIGNPELKLRMLLRQIDDLQIPIEKSDNMKHIHVGKRNQNEID